MRRFFGKLVKRKSKRAKSTVASGSIVEAESAEIGPIFANIVNLKHRLSDISEPDFGLLDHLLRLNVLSRKQYEDVRSEKGAAYRRSEAVLDMLKTEDQCDKFLKALQRTGQQHVVNFIVANKGQNST